MAQSLKLTGQVHNTTNALKLAINNLTITTAGDHMDFGRIVATQASEATHTIATDIGNCGIAMFINKGPTNFVDIGWQGTGDYPIRLKSGEFAIVRLPTTTATLYLLADTADVDVEYWILED